MKFRTRATITVPRIARCGWLVMCADSEHVRPSPCFELPGVEAPLAKGVDACRSTRPIGAAPAAAGDDELAHGTRHHRGKPRTLGRHPRLRGGWTSPSSERVRPVCPWIGSGSQPRWSPRPWRSGRLPLAEGHVLQSWSWRAMVMASDVGGHAQKAPAAAGLEHMLM